jgi:protein involved in polysaccharide export with SLBB domain
MPVRYHGRLLAEWGAMLSVCLAAAGCQTSLPRTDAPLAVSAPNNNAQPSSPFLSLFRGERGDQGTGQGQVVSMMRPIAVDDDAAAVAPASGWSPIVRTSGEQVEPPAGQANPVIASSPGTTNTEPTSQPVVDPPGQLPPPTPVGPSVVVEPPPLAVHGGAAPGIGAGPPREFDKRSYPTYIVEPPDILQIGSTKGLLDQPVNIRTPVSMDGTINLGIYGLVYVSGMTVDGVREAVTAQLARRIKDLDSRSVAVEVIAYNSKVYYIITDGGGYGQQVARFPATGNETVLDALAQVGGLGIVSSKKHIWLARATPGDAAHPQIMPVDWCGITQRGSGATNYQLFPGDRIFVSSDPWVRTDTWLARRLAPIQNILGTVLLGSTTVNSIRGINSGFAP